MRARLLTASAVAIALLASGRILSPLLKKARYTVWGERALPGGRAELARDVWAILALYGCADSWRFALAWVASLLSRKNPLSSEVPWIPYAALQYLERRLPREAVVFEWGGGGSTLWLSRRAAAITTVEHDRSWHALLQERLRERCGAKSTVLLVEPEQEEATVRAPAEPVVWYSSARAAGSFERYVRAIDGVPDASLDLVVVDGRSRVACVLHAASKLRPGGLLMLDDSYRPRYERAKRALANWPREEFCGIRPYSLSPSRTTFWTRPAEASCSDA